MSAQVRHQTRSLSNRPIRSPWFSPAKGALRPSVFDCLVLALAIIETAMWRRLVTTGCTDQAFNEILRGNDAKWTVFSVLDDGQANSSRAHFAEDAISRIALFHFEDPALEWFHRSLPPRIQGNNEDVDESCDHSIF